MDERMLAVFRSSLEKDVPVILADIRKLYTALDRCFNLHGADLPITFGYETDVLGSYSNGRDGDEEEFHFSLYFVGYALPNPLSREDRLDLYKHEYAHYMQYHMDIPKEYQFKPGKHGSAWKYCCSLVGAAPTELYKVGEGKIRHDYDKHLRNPINDKTVPIRDRYRREQEYRRKQDTRIRYEVGDRVEHPKFGPGTIERVEQTESSVRLTIRFGEEVKKLDQKWIIKAGYR